MWHLPHGSSCFNWSLELIASVVILLQGKIEKLKQKMAALEAERDTLKESEADLESKVRYKIYVYWV